MEFIFLILCGLMILVSYYANHRMINVATVFITPYMVIIPFNNFIMIHFGFYTINSQTILLVMGSLFCIFLGTLPVAAYMHNSREKVQMYYAHSRQKFENYRMKPMLYYVIFIEIIAAFRLLFLIHTHGVSYLPTNDFEGKMISGPLGHLLLTGYPLAPVLFYYWMKNGKKLSYLIVSLVYLIFMFLTFVKYHSIGLIMITFFFLVLEDVRYLKKGVFAVVILACAFFVFNYVVSFAIRGTVSETSNSFYINHLWKYIVGSLIYDNSIFTNIGNTEISILTKLGRAVVPPINIFLNKFFGYKLFYNSLEPLLPIYLDVGTNGEKGNVMDAFGAYFPVNKDMVELFLYVLALVIVGLLFSVVYNYILQNKERFPITLCILLTFFSFFSFFGTFYVNLPPWEILSWSVFMLTLFNRRVKFRHL